MGFLSSIIKQAAPLVGGYVMGGPIGTAIGSGVAGLISEQETAGQYREQLQLGREANAQRIAMADKQMDFQERMSNTAHQREIKDLRAAGLNPILSSKYGGASTPGGAMAQIADIAAPATSSAVARRTQDAQMNQMAAQTNAAMASASYTKQQEANAKLQAENIKQEEILLRDRQIQTRLASAKSMADYNVSQAQAANYDAETALKVQEAEIKSHTIPGAKIEGDIDRTEYGKWLRYLNRASTVTSTATGLAGRYLGAPKIFKK